MQFYRSGSYNIASTYAVTHISAPSLVILGQRCLAQTLRREQHGSSFLPKLDPAFPKLPSLSDGSTHTCTICLPNVCKTALPGLHWGRGHSPQGGFIGGTPPLSHTWTQHTCAGGLIIMSLVEVLSLQY